MVVFQNLLVACGLTARLGTLLSFSKNPHWAVRMWDFPRLQLAVVSALSGVLYSLRHSRRTRADWALLLETTLSYEPERKGDQEPATPAAGDEEEAAEKISTQQEAARKGEDRPG